jgi:hypothetical protein
MISLCWCFLPVEHDAGSRVSFTLPKFSVAKIEVLTEERHMRAAYRGFSPLKSSRLSASRP